MGGGMHEEDEDRGHDEGGCVDGEGRSRPEACHEQAAERGAGQPERDRADELVERVRRRQVRRRDDVGDDRVERGREERRADAVEGDEDRELPEREEARDGERRQHADDDRAPDVRAEHEPATVDAVAEDARREEEDERRDRHRDAEEGQRRGRVPQLVGLPGHRDQEDAVAEEGDGHPGPEHPEVPVPERGEEVDPREAARTVEPLVAMLHASAARPRGTRRAPRCPSAWRTGIPGRARSRDRGARRSAPAARCPPRRRRG